MNDRFKFRAWHKPTKRLFEIWSFTPSCVYENTVNGIYTSPTNPAKLEDCVLEQSTGLKDKNGRLIYEGDIVRNGSPSISHNIYKVEYNSVNANYGLTNKYDDHCFCYAMSLEVIGNIHENKNLLEAAE